MTSRAKSTFRHVVPEGTDEVLDPTWESEDIVAVRKVFTLFDEIIEKTNGRLQIIVLDHASEEVWGGLKKCPSRR
jgi:hypothetical protein